MVTIKIRNKAKIKKICIPCSAKLKTTVVVKFYFRLVITVQSS